MALNISELKKRYKTAINKRIVIVVNQREYSEQVFEELSGFLLEKGYQRRPIHQKVKFVEFDPVEKQQEKKEKEITYEIDE